MFCLKISLRLLLLFAKRTMRISIVCDEGRFISPEECRRLNHAVEEIVFMCAFNLPPGFAVLPLAKRESFY